jgi:RNA polymerase sigma factor (sigma-70 family)
MKVSGVQHLEALFDAGTFAGMPDGLLLERFVVGRDGPALEAIVARHGPMVFNVCRRVLHERSDVDDAFQATFLILIRKAGVIRDGQRLGPWLYGVAHRVASRARAQAIKRRAKEGTATIEAAVETRGDVERRELLAALDEEVTRLPAKFRAAVVLCDLEGMTYEEAARQLDWALGTLKSRLVTGRKRLRSRLIRRGFAPAAVTIAADLAANFARAEVPAQLAAATARTVLCSIMGRAAAAGGISAAVRELTEGVLKAMFISRLATIGAVLLLIGTCATGLGVVAQQPRADTQYDDQIRDLDERIQALQRFRAALKERRQYDAERRKNKERVAAQLEKLGAAIEWDVVTVNLAGARVTDDDLKVLPETFPALRTLYLHHDPITDAGVNNLKGLSGLTTLDLFDTHVTDAALERVAEWMPNLESLELSDTGITDSGLRFLKGLHRLRRLDVRKTKVTQAGADELHRALPGVEILR